MDLGKSIRLIKLFGIKINIHFSWFFIFIMLVFNLATAVFPIAGDNWGQATYWTLSVVATSLFFLSVLVHEMAHSIAAIKLGLPVKSITLFILGGVASIEKEPESPKDEFIMTAVGPLSSLALGVIFSAASIYMAGVFLPVAVLFSWLGSVNVILGLFNLVPGFPLDGGRIVRAALWAGTKDLLNSTKWSSYLGRLTAMTFTAAGIAMIFGITLPLFGTGVASGSWLIFIGLFLNFAATHSYEQLLMKHSLDGLSVDKIMRSSYEWVAPLAPVTNVVEKLKREQQKILPVVDNNQIVGFITKRDIEDVPEYLWADIAANKVMQDISSIPYVSPEQNTREVIEEIRYQDVDEVPVFENGRLRGFLGMTDIFYQVNLNSKV